MTNATDELFGGASRLSKCVRDLGYSGSPLPLEEWSKLRAIIASMQTDGGSKRVNLPPAIVSCAQCGTMQVRSAAEVMKSGRRGLTNFYCSNRCWGAGENVRRFGERVCVRCGESAPKRASVGSPGRGRIYCSKECQEQERSEEFEQRALSRMKPCARCNSMFMPANSATQFCSRPCASRAHAGRMAKTGNPRWKDGASASRVKPHVTRRFRELRPMVMKRDGHKCVLCDGMEKLEVHHIDEDPLSNRVSNLVTLCRACHEKVHFSAEKTTLSQLLKTHAEAPLSTTYRWKKQNASSPTVS